MSGRGGRGGRGGGRGGFGRGPPVGPVARDEDGTVLSSAPVGPPPLYPETELPEHPDIEAQDKMLLFRRRDLQERFKASPYFMESHKEEEEGAKELGADLFEEQGADKATKRRRTALATVMTLIPDYFPEELYSSKDMRASKLQTLKGADAYFRMQSKGDMSGLSRLEQLAKLESAGEGGEGAPGQKKPGEQGDDDGAPEEELQHDTDEEEDMEFDDYYQGEHFDDDEGYGDDYGDGGDEGPVY